MIQDPLVTALEPFAKGAKEIPASWPDNRGFLIPEEHPDNPKNYNLLLAFVHDFRRAATALAEHNATIVSGDLQHLVRWASQNTHDGARDVIESDGELQRCMRLSDGGWIACEQHARGIIPHVTRKTLKLIRSIEEKMGDADAKD